VHKPSKDNQQIGIGHENWNLVLHMIFGVSKSVKNSELSEAFEIIEDDFRVKMEVISERGNPMDSASYRFFDFAPRVFHQLRMLYGISSE
jgi:hypothetical protein